MVLLLAGILSGTLPQAAGGELIIFPDGGFLKVTAYEVVGDRVRLRLPNGGLLVVALERVDRILADEIDKRPPVPPPPSPAAFSLRFAPDQPPPDVPYGELIFTTARRHALNPGLVAAVVRAESAFRPTAVSPRGARGLMQLMPATARRFGLRVEELFEPAANLDAGVRYLRWLADRFDDRLALVLAAYNAGEGSVDRYQGVPPYRETRDYLRRIYATLGLTADGGSGATSTDEG